MKPSSFEVESTVEDLEHLEVSRVSTVEAASLKHDCLVSCKLLFLRQTAVAKCFPPFFLKPTIVSSCVCSNCTKCRTSSMIAPQSSKALPTVIPMCCPARSFS